MRQLRRLVRYIAPYTVHCFASVILMAAVGLLETFRLLLIGPTIDRVLNPASNSQNIELFKVPGSEHFIYLQQLVPSHFTNAWTIVMFSFVAATILKGLCDYLGTYLINYAGFGMITDLRNEVYEAVLRRSVAFFQRVSTGTVVSTVINDVDRVQSAMCQGLAEFLQQFFTFVFTSAAIILLGRKYSLVLLIFVPFIILSATKIGHRVRRTARSGQDRLADIQNILHETITGVRIVKAFSMELWELLRFRGAAKTLFNANLRSARAAAVTSPLMDIFGSIAISMLLLMGRDAIKNGAFTAGTFLAFIFLVFRLYDPVRKFALINNYFQQALGASASVFAFMDFKDNVREKSGARDLAAFHEEIRFDHVTFSYECEHGEERDILRDIDLTVPAGEVVAIVGSSGAGKSTLVHLIPRFFDVSHGRLLIDGHDVRDLTLGSLRSQIGIVTQETILFNDTVRNNIAYGQPNVVQAKVEEAARMALAHDFISALPNGYETIIGERGLRLSGGERQRIAIARAILKNAPILILDEATSALDSESESLVQAALHNLMQGRTVFVIAHRLSTVRHANRILVIENGRIADSGSHEDLMKRLGTYRRLYELQFMDMEAVAAKLNGVPVSS